MKLEKKIKFSTSIVFLFVFHYLYSHRLEFPSVLVLYQDIIVSIHGINILTGFVDRQLFCTSEDLVETYKSTASPYCTVSGRLIETTGTYRHHNEHLVSFLLTVVRCLTTCVQLTWHTIRLLVNHEVSFFVFFF